MRYRDIFCPDNAGKPFDGIFSFSQYLISASQLRGSVGQDLFYFFPVRGRKLVNQLCNQNISYHLFYFFPVRGRKQYTSVPVSNQDGIYFISSPSGDGNEHCEKKSRRTIGHLFYFFPVRGRKLMNFQFLLPFEDNLFYFFPVRGRKPYLLHLLQNYHTDFILFLPRQGTETPQKFITFRILTNGFILFLPRQGTETQVSCTLLRDSAIYFISSPSGDGNSLSCMGVSLMAFILFLPRQGTETKISFIINTSTEFNLFYFFPVRGRKLLFFV